MTTIHLLAEAVRQNLREGEWVLHCVACGFEHEKMTAARPVCDNCGKQLYLTCAPTPIRIPRIASPTTGRLVCVNDEYLAALEKILAGGAIDSYLQAFQPTRRA